VEGHSADDLQGEDRRHKEVDGGAKRRPPPGARNELCSVLPEVFEAMSCVPGYHQPDRSGDTYGCEDKECRSDRDLDGDDLCSAVSHGEADVNGRDERDIQPSADSGSCG